MIPPRVVGQELVSQARRYVLVSLSMLLGVTGVVAIAVGNSIAADMLIAHEEQLNGREFTFQANVAESVDLTSSDVNVLQDQLELALDSPAVTGIAVERETAGLARTPAGAENLLPGVSVATHWSTASVDAIRRVPVLRGESSGRGSCYPGVVALNEPAAAALNVGLGGSVSYRIETDQQPRLFVVGAIVADGASDPNAYASWATLECAYPELAQLSGASILIVTDAPGAASLLQQVVSEALSRQGAVMDGGVRRIDTVATIRSQVETLSILFGGCAVLLLAVSALGIASVGIASVAERARELVVRRAFGARRVDVFAQVIAGSAVVGVFVGLLAAGLAVVGTYIVLPAYIPAASAIVPPTFPWSACAAGFGAAVATGILGGLVPAIRATRLPVARAMRS